MKKGDRSHQPAPFPKTKGAEAKEADDEREQNLVRIPRMLGAALVQGDEDERAGGQRDGSPDKVDLPELSQEAAFDRLGWNEEDDAEKRYEAEGLDKGRSDNMW